jgi:hypothetical protein
MKKYIIREPQKIERNLCNMLLGASVAFASLPALSRPHLNITFSTAKMILFETDSQSFVSKLQEHLRHYGLMVSIAY